MEGSSNRILLTGSRGSVGSLFWKSLSSADLGRLVVVDVKKPKTLPNSVRFYKVNLIAPGADAKLAEILQKEEIHTVFHTALWWNPARPRADAHELEVIGTLALLSACHERSISKLIVSSSTLVYGAKATNPNYLKESDPLYSGRSNRYLRDKVEVEEEVRRFRRRHPKSTVTVLRPCMILGPNLNHFFAYILSQPVIPTVLGYDPLIQFIDERDFLRAVRIVMENDHHGEFNIVGKGVLPLSYAVKLTGKLNVPVIYALAKPALSVLWNMNLIEFPSEMLDFFRYLWVADGDKAKREMGFEAKHTSKDALERFVGQQRLRKMRLVPSEVSV